MPHATLKLVPGTDTQETQALNANAGISDTQLIRFFPDRNGLALVQKIGGWQKFYPSPMAAPVRQLWAWEDLNDNSWLAVGTETIEGATNCQLAAIAAGTLSDITPTQITNSAPAVISTTAGSASVLITDSIVTGITNYDAIYIATQISIGGIVLFGLYSTDPEGFIGPSGYSVRSIDILGNANPATSTSSLPVLPSFTTIGPSGSVPGSTTVTVTLPYYTYAAGDTFPVLVPTEVGGITLFGNYIVQQLVSATQFTIIANAVATFSDTQTLNGGNALFIYNIGYGAIPAGTGFGIGPFGFGGFGTGTPVAPPSQQGNEIPAVDWTLDNFGQDLIACAVQQNQTTPFQPIYVWTPGSQNAVVISQAPPVNDGIFVAMPQRQIIAWGSTQTGIQDPLLINWCDIGNYSQWIALVTNQAGSYRIPKGSRIVAAMQGPQQGIVWTDVDVWSMQYIGTPYVYSFNEIGTGCGLIGRHAAAFVNGIGYWMGPSQFFTLSSSGVQAILCSVWDVIFQNLDQSNLDKIRVAVNSRFGEISWFYPSITGSGAAGFELEDGTGAFLLEDGTGYLELEDSTGGGTGEVDSYVKLNIALGVWDYGTLARSAWVDQSVLGPPVGADPVSLYLYQHETSNDADGAAMQSSFQTGYFATSEADVKAFVDLIWPDFKWGQYSQAQQATVMITFFVADYPGDTPVAYGPYSVTQATEYFYTRFRGRLMSVKIASDDLGSFWRIGAIRYRFAQDGKF